MKVGYVYDPLYLEHDTGDHVENAGRLKAIMGYLEKTGLKAKLTALKPTPATPEEIALVHDRHLIEQVKRAAESGGGWLDPDTVVSPRSYDAAVLAAGGAMTAVEAVVSGEVDSAFALVRPPGHHATRTQAMGFCLFNNIAIAARYALANLGIERIQIIDFDVHHGNGTQDAFNIEPRVGYISTHQHPNYPGTGAMDEIGDGPAKGTKVNIPLPPGCGDAEYARVYERIVIPAARRFRPQLIMVSAGYDAHWADELALLALSVRGYASMVRSIKELAGEVCGGKMVLCLEGGYNLAALGAAVGATFAVLLGEEDIPDPVGPRRSKPSAPDISGLINTIRQVHGLE